MTVETAQALSLTRTIAASREAVFEAWTRPEHLRMWCCPDPTADVEVHMDLHVGGAFTLKMGRRLLRIGPVWAALWALPVTPSLAAQDVRAYENGNPAFSPDGRHVAFEAIRDGNREIFIANADGTGILNLSRHPASEMHPSWTPDGTGIVFDSDRSGSPDIYIMNPDGSGVRRLTHDPAVDLVGIVSPDGTRLAFNSLREGQWDVFVMDLRGSEAVNLTRNPATDIMRSWSEDGAVIQFDSDRDGNPDGHREAYVMRPDGSRQTRLTDHPADDRFLRRGPPGTRTIAFMSTRGDGGTRGIWLMERDGSDVRVLYDGPGADFFPTWSPDGTQVVFYSDEGGYGDLYVADRNGRGKRRFLRDEPPAVLRGSLR